MPIPSRPHPLYNDLRLQRDEAREVNGQLLRFRDLAQRDDPHQSGIPDLFRPWALQHLRRICLENPWYVAQTQNMIGKLQSDLGKLQKERDDLQAAFDMRIEAVGAQIDELVAVLPSEGKKSRDALPVVVTE